MLKDARRCLMTLHTVPTTLMHNHACFKENTHTELGHPSTYKDKHPGDFLEQLCCW